MDESNEPSAGSGVRVAVLTTHQDTGRAFVRTACGTAGEMGETTIDDRLFHLQIVSDAQAGDGPERADALVLLIRFMDAITMDQLRALARGVPRESKKPLAVVLFRDEGETDFKMSCPACGQKLWVRDADEGKRGRCPKCKTSFHLPSQGQHAKHELLLPTGTPIVRVVRGNPRSATNALVHLVDYFKAGEAKGGPPFDPEALLRTTVRIEIDDDHPA